MAGAYDYRARGAGGELLQRIRLVVSGGLRCGESDAAPGDPRHLPARCVFQFSGADSASVTFPLEYVLRLMKNWARAPCDPYVRIQNTGVSVLFQGFFFAPSGAAATPITSERNNVILRSTQATGLALSELERLKRGGGLDLRPLQAMMQVCCFTRMPVVQLSFRFMGPEDASRTQRLLDRAASFGEVGRPRGRSAAAAAAHPEDVGCFEARRRERSRRRTPPGRGAGEVFASLASMSSALALERAARRPWWLAAVGVASAALATIAITALLPRLLG
ncbi:nuclear egress membrane protein [Equid herpesvirus 6]|uniref:Nuclear egress membrane protein n=1 Tax=Equid herpesvirus 6 TaxID=173566 RepID=A0A7S9VM21_9ALPH|nr:nuclear egress membrane protein [Equid herpesvirus 6]QPI70137.1 nuclear egress membrane protein [Equid herpesvirus 6]